MSEQEKCSCKSSCCNTAKKPDSNITIIDTHLSRADKWGAFKMRLGIGRDNYAVEPGLYGIGKPSAAAPVLVTANYKLTLDTLRKELSGIAAWILVLDTKGINVWCAAGKGTFGTAELVYRVNETKLSEFVSHKVLILPQLGAPGVAAHEVQKQTGFHVVYGPVRACDIPAFLETGMKATENMRRVRFGLRERIVLAPVELAALALPALYVFGTLFVAWLLSIAKVAWLGTLPYIGAVIMGCIVTPVLLPWIPGRSFALKGWLIGALYSAALIVLTSAGWQQAVIYATILPPISGFLALNFTGASTYTSHSGVIKESKRSLPVFILSAAAGFVFALLYKLIGF